MEKRVYWTYNIDSQIQIQIDFKSLTIDSVPRIDVKPSF